MNILKQLFNAGFKPGTCSDLVEWLEDQPKEVFDECSRLITDNFFRQYIDIVVSSNTELRKPLSIEDFTGEDALFEGWDQVGVGDNFNELTNGFHCVDFFAKRNKWVIPGQSIQDPTREDFIRNCNKHGIDLTPNTEVKGTENIV